MTVLLERLNELLFAAVLIVGFSLLTYVTLQHRRSALTRSIGVLFAAVLAAYAGDVLLARAARTATVEFLGRMQWIGVALVPGAYVHFANALLALNGAEKLARRRRWTVWAAYAVSGFFLVLVITGTNLVIRGELPDGPVAQFRAGPLFWAYVVYFVVGGLTALAAIVRVRQMALTPTQRRRLSYLTATFAAPGIAVFPFLVVGAPTFVPGEAIQLLQALASLTVMVMLTIMTYSVAFQGVLVPERLVKQDFLRWWLYGPFIGLTTILFIQAVPLPARWFGLPEETLITFGVMVMTVVMPMLVTRVRPYLDALIYRQDHEEIDYLRSLPRSTFTRADLRALLENSLAAICAALRVETGFVAAPGEQGFAVRATWGERGAVRRLVSEVELPALIERVQQLPPGAAGDLLSDGWFVETAGFCVLPLRSPDGLFLGAIGVEATSAALQQSGTTETARLLTMLAHQIELGLTTVEFQRQIFDALRGLAPEVETLQRVSTQIEQATPATLSRLEQGVAERPEFTALVKDALTQFWGGPKLAESPLVELRAVRQLLSEHSNSPTKALQALLRQAIANLRPDEQIDPSAQEWLLFHLAEGRFLKRQSVRETAHRLAMSESDFYRKQRAAVEAVAQQILTIEAGSRDEAAVATQQG
jgi:hypothetical protein